MKYFSVIDFVYGPIALLAIILYARLTKYKRIELAPEFEYYSKGLYVKIIGGLSVCFIYTLYYGGGDTTNYFHDSLVVSKLLLTNPAGFFKIIFSGLTPENMFFFTNETGTPMYWDKPTFFVVRISAPLTILSGGSFVVLSLYFALLSYAGNWRLYKVFVSEFPELRKEMAIAILFIPSVFFWGSGLLKDTITLSCIGFYTYAFYNLFIRRQNITGNTISIIISSYLILMIKPYIIFALLPGSIIWLINRQVISMKNKVLKVMVGPAFLLIGIGGGYLILSNMAGVLGDYSIESVLEKAVITNTDLKSEYYQGNSVDIGEFEATIPSMLSKAPAAINLAIFRPYLWEANNIVMIVSGLECLIILLFTLRVLFRVRIYKAFTLIFKNHMLSFSIIFSLFFAFSVGISTSNFGSLVRYRIPVLPFFIASLFIIEYLHRKSKTVTDNEVENQDENEVKIT